MSSDNYRHHSLMHDRHDEVVQSLQYNISTYSLSGMACGTTNFSVTFTDIGDHDEVILSCGLFLFAAHNLQHRESVSVVLCKLLCHYFKHLHPCSYYDSDIGHTDY